MLFANALVAIVSYLTIVSANHPFDLRSVDPDIFTKADVSYRLPNTTHPETYDISLFTRIDQNNFDFNGQVKIGIVVDRDTREIVLHARQLTITTVQLKRIVGSMAITIPILPFTFEVQTEFLRIQTVNLNLVPGDQLELEITYNGVLREDELGFYKSSYVNANGVRTWLATTQFESTEARHGFPCYDEPALKAKFKIQITHGIQYHALSNMPELREEDNRTNTATTSFSETPLTSSYLIAFVISDFKFISNNGSSNGQFPHRVYAWDSEVKNTQLGLQDGQRILSALENYLNVKFSLPKMDQIAIPDFNAGAMENWGLVTYRPSALLYNEKIHPYTRKTTVVTIISHEFGHQWFGNLVTPKWWQYIWLNEGFANLFEHIGTDLVYPEWKIFNYYVVRTLQNVLDFDAHQSTREMSLYVESPAAIASLFDSIAYAKSGSVLRMFLHALTQNTFKKGITNYLRKNSYKAADETDLFAALDGAAKEDKTLDNSLNVPTIFSSWSNQKGFPLLTVERDYKKNTITLKQNRYISPKVTANDTSSWWIPYNYASAKNANFEDTTPNGWLSPADKAKVLTGNWTADEWVLFNKQQTGFYRVLYDENNWKLLSKQLNSDNYSSIHTINRAQVIDDAFEFAQQGLLKYNVFFDLIRYLSRESEFTPWWTAYKVLSSLDRLFASSKNNEKYQQFVAKLTEKAFKLYGIDDKSNEPHLDKYTRTFITNLACSHGLESCLNSTYLALQGVLNSNQSPVPNVFSLLYQNGIRNATDTEVSKLWERLTKSQNEAEVESIASSFGNVKNKTLLDVYLNKTIQPISNPIFNKNIRFHAFSKIISSGEQGLSLGIRLVKNNPLQVTQYLGNLNFVINRLASYIVHHSLHSQFDDLLKVLRSNEHISVAHAETANKILHRNFEWIETHQKHIETWLNNPNSNSSSTAVVSSITLVFSILFYSILF